ncbi:hypothetical protein G3I42_28415 [Streptomyces sp. SID11385]|nr:hypothetical protein [Streptomyces sp. SID11385]
MVVISALSALVVATGLVVAWGVGVFSSQGEIAAADVCEQVPNRGEVAKTLHAVLPKVSEYSFDESGGPTDNPRFHYFCLVDGSDGPLLDMDVRPTSLGDNWKEWEIQAVNDVDALYTRDLSPFPAGEHAVASSRTAAIADPCFSADGKAGGGQRFSLTTVVKARKPLRLSDDKARSALMRLVADLGRKMHKDAQCDVPSRLTGK